MAWLVLVVTALLLAGSVAQKAYRFTLPTDGWSFGTGVEDSRPVYDRSPLGRPSPLRKGDLLLAIEGQPYERVLSRVWGPRPPAIAGWRAGSTVDYTVLRDGQVVHLAVPLYLWNPVSALVSVLTDLLVLGAIPLAVVGWFVFLRRPNVWAARPLLLFAVSLLAAGISASTVDWGPPEVADLDGQEQC